METGKIGDYDHGWDDVAAVCSADATDESAFEYDTAQSAWFCIACQHPRMKHSTTELV